MVMVSLLGGRGYRDCKFTQVGGIKIKKSQKYILFITLQVDTPTKVVKSIVTTQSNVL